MSPNVVIKLNGIPGP